MNYYNEFDPKAAAWLRELIKEGHIPDGWVDERSILDVKPHELHEYTQCHFFAGISGWALALQLAGWPEDQPCWTGSCPCQPYSVAGKGKGDADERNLWPAFRALISACRPTVVFGEQVASAAVVGKQGKGQRLSTCLQEEKQSQGSDEACALSLTQEGRRIQPRPIYPGASGEDQSGILRDKRTAVQLGGWEDLGQPILRQEGSEEGIRLREYQDCLPCSERSNGRLGRSENAGDCESDNGSPSQRLQRALESARRLFDEESGGVWSAGVFADLEEMGYAVASSDIPAAGVGAPHIRQRLYWVADPADSGRLGRRAGKASDGRASARIESERLRASGGLGDSNSTGSLSSAHRGIHRGEEVSRPRDGEPQRSGAACGLEHAQGDGRQQRRAESRRGSVTGGCGASGVEYSDEQGCEGQPLGLLGASHQGNWSRFDILPCTDGKARRVESGTFPLAHGVSGRVGLLRGYGNAIVPEVAAQFIRAFLEVKQSQRK